MEWELWLNWPRAPPPHHLTLLSSLLILCDILDFSKLSSIQLLFWWTSWGCLKEETWFGLLRAWIYLTFLVYLPRDGASFHPFVLIPTAALTLRYPLCVYILIIQQLHTVWRHLWSHYMKETNGLMGKKARNTHCLSINTSCAPLFFLPVWPPVTVLFDLDTERTEPTNLFTTF